VANVLSSRLPKSLYNVVIVGEAGVGKSSLINLALGSSEANVANDVRGVTAGTTCYEWEKNDTEIFRLWDTPGLNDGPGGNVPPKRAEDALRSLLTELHKAGGIHLLVFCMRGGAKVARGVKQIYDTIISIRDKVSPGVPIVAVVTELERRSTLPDVVSSMETWWTRNPDGLSDLAFSGHACITTLTDDCLPAIPGRYDCCQRLVRELFTEYSLPPSYASSVYNVVIVGETGVGKSSLINLVIGSTKAETTNNVSGIIGTTCYEWKKDNAQTFRLWDTPGFGQGVGGGVSSKRAKDALRSLLMELHRTSGVHLLAFCIRGGPKVTNKTYNAIISIRDKLSPRFPIVAVVTHLEKMSTAVVSSMDAWWTSSRDGLSKLTFSGHACITTLTDDCYPRMPGRHDQCQRLVRELITTYSLPPYYVPLNHLHIMLFGETGVGKSSLINLLTGWHAAEVSPNFGACTMDAKEYQFQLGPTIIRLWDTVGLEEPEEGPNGYEGAIEKAIQLIRRLNATGGISLFLFCMRGNRITATTQSNYRLFYEVLGKKEVPVALAITHLERERVMEEWWSRNYETLSEKNGITSAGHACITTLEGHQKCKESREVIQSLLSRFDDRGKFSMPSEAWIARVLKGLRWLVGKVFPRQEDLIDILTTRCRLENEVAQRVAAQINQR
jgi:predicted GTPase